MQLGSLKQDFITLCREARVLKFGDFTLKSGRQSPYFFNAGAFDSGRTLNLLGEAYAHHIHSQSIDFDMLFGPAYKGIPLVATVATALFRLYDRDYPLAFNRKESKDHGEGGFLVGAPLQGRVLLIDDVITAGTAIGEVAALIQASPEARLAGVVVALDREESIDPQSRHVASQVLSARLKVPITSIIRRADLTDSLQRQDG